LLLRRAFGFGGLRRFGRLGWLFLPAFTLRQWPA